MDSSGKIYTPEQMTAMEERARKRMQEIPDDQVGAVTKMNRKQRRAWFVQQRRAATRVARAKVSSDD